MNPIDIAIVIIGCYCLLRGVFRGIIKEVASIIGVFAGFYAGYTYYPLLQPLLQKWIANATYLNLIGFIAIFCAVFIIVSLIGVLIRYLLNIAFLGWIDRFFGAVFGAFKAVLIAGVILIALTAFLPKGAPVIRQSKLAPHITIVTETLAQLIPPDMKTIFYNKVSELKKHWHPNTDKQTN